MQSAAFYACTPLSFALGHCRCWSHQAYGRAVKILEKFLTLLNLGDRPELEEDTKLSLKLSNGSRIVALPGSQRTIRGFSSPDLIIIDEDGQAEDELFEGVYPMMNSNPNGRMILASTPWLPSGHFHKIWTEGVGWLKIKITCYENPRLSAETIAEAKLTAKSSSLCQRLSLSICRTRRTNILILSYLNHYQILT